MQNINFYFVDESKPFEGKPIEIHCCVITSTPDSLRKNIASLKEELLDKSLYKVSWDQLKKSGFHACENHPNIRDRFIDLLLTLNFRAYLIIAETRSHVAHQTLIKKLLQDRLIKRKYDKNIITFEQNLSKVTQDAKNKKADELCSFIKTFAPKVNVNVEVSEKSEEPLLSIPDYVAHIVKNRFFATDLKPFMLNHYEQICPKIACVSYYNQKRFFRMRNRSDREEVINFYSRLFLG